MVNVPAGLLDRSQIDLNQAGEGPVGVYSRLPGRNVVTNPECLIRLRDVSVDLPVYNAANQSIRLVTFDLAVGGRFTRNRSRLVTVRALDGVNLDLRSGDRIGLLGHNGSGKTTLLKVIAGIYEPTSGQVGRATKVSTLLNFDAGIDQEISGLDAIHIGCTLRGLHGENFKRMREEIIEFCELGDFLTLPLRAYSSGMRARLLFAIATCDRPRAVVIDEHFAAGDASFMRKAHDRIIDLVDNASLMVIATHSEELLKAFCTEAVLLKNGAICFRGAIDEAIELYNSGHY